MLGGGTIGDMGSEEFIGNVFVKGPADTGQDQLSKLSAEGWTEVALSGVRPPRNPTEMHSESEADQPSAEGQPREPLASLSDHQGKRPLSSSRKGLRRSIEDSLLVEQAEAMRGVQAKAMLLRAIARCVADVPWEKPSP